MSYDIMAIKILTRVCVCVWVCVPRMSLYFVPKFQMIIQFNKKQNLSRNAWDWPWKSKTKFSGWCILFVLYLWLVTFIATPCMCRGMDMEWSCRGFKWKESIFCWATSDKKSQHHELRFTKETIILGNHIALNKQEWLNFNIQASNDDTFAVNKLY